MRRARRCRAMAVATPAMFPTPTVEASAVATAWKGETVPGPALFCVILPSTSRKAKAEIAELDAARQYGQQHARAQEQHDRRPTPDEAVQPAVCGGDLVHHSRAPSRRGL